jgi:hypothetical protein
MAAAAKSTVQVSGRSVEVVHKRLVAIRKSKGSVTPAAVVEDARAASSPLHRYFDWDDSSAAEKFRLVQASNLIRKVQIMVSVNDEQQPVRRWLHVVREEQHEYIPQAEVAEDPELSAQVIEAARQALEGWSRRFEIYSELFDSTTHVKEAIRALPKAREKKGTKPDMHGGGLREF